VNTLEKYVKILSLFSEVAPVLSVPEIASQLNLPISTAYRHVSALKQQGLIDDAGAPGTYRLGTKILELARSVLRKSLQEIARPAMTRLTEKTGETVILSGLHREQGICLERVEGHHALRVSYERGAIFPLHAGASGKALAAFLPAERLEEIIAQAPLERFSETTITNPDTLRDELAEIRKRGIAYSDGEVLPETYGVAAPILTSSGSVVAVLSISAPSHRMQGKNRNAVAKLVAAAAREISKEYEMFE
jgi:DNA-binding IclR family transcriptional regulator